MSHVLVSPEKGIVMFSRLQPLKQLFVFVLFLGLASCNVSADVNQGARSVNVIEGSSSNLTLGGVDGGTISGGGQVPFPNQILRDFGVIAGGRDNTAGNFSTVGGGESNNAEGIRATIGGGANNTATRNSTVIAGGYGNTASQSYATVGGGILNVADDMYTTISGGSGNLASGRISTISGGTRNQTLSAYTTIGGGIFNSAIGGTSTIAGGTQNDADGIGSAIGGGAGNNAAGLQSSIGGGLGNQTTDNYSLVAGGRGNLAGNGIDDSEDAPYASVGGGNGNLASGAYATVPGGNQNQALGAYSLAAGNQAQVEQNHPGAFLFADSSDFVFPSSTANEFAVRATGGVRFITGLDADGEPLVGVRLSSSSGAWETLSDRNSKAAILPVDGRQVLDILMRMPISTWRYRGQPESVQHLGPMAQDFYAAFGLGEDAHYIGSVDADGVALASIQGLYQLVEEKDARIVALENQNADQEQRLNDLGMRLADLEGRANQPPPQSYGFWFTVVPFLIGLVFGRYLLVWPRTT